MTPPLAAQEVCDMQVVMQPISAPRGLSLIDQVRLYQRAHVAEFQPPPPGPQRPAQFPTYDVVEAIGARDTPPARRAQAVAALDEFMRAPGRLARQFRAQLRELVTAGDHPTGATMQAYIDRFLITPGEADFGWRMIFQTHDPATAMGQLVKSYFKVLNVTSGIVFKKRAAGEPVDFLSMQSTESIVEYDMFGGGVSIDRVWWDDQDYLTIADVLMMFREAYYFKQAGDFYGLVTAVDPAQNYATGADLTAKINGACADIIRALQGKGYSVNTGSTFIILHSPEGAGAVDAVLLTRGEIATSQRIGKVRLQWRVAPVGTVHVPSAGARSGTYVILPGNQLKAGLRMDLTLFGQFNPARYADDLAGFGRYAGIVGDVQQIRRIPN